MTTPFPDFGWQTTLVFKVPTGDLTQEAVGPASAATNRISYYPNPKVKKTKDRLARAMFQGDCILKTL
jgi:hypothetical protein